MSDEQGKISHSYLSLLRARRFSTIEIEAEFGPEFLLNRIRRFISFSR